MRYRPFGRSGLALSNIGLNLRWEKLHKNRSLLQKLIFTALENGINTYHFDSAEPGFLQSASEIFGVVERKLLFISINAHEPTQAPDASVCAMPVLKDRLRSAIKDSGFHWIDLLLFDQPAAEFIPDDSLNFLDSLKRSKMLRYVGTTCEAEQMADLVASGNFDVIKTSYDIDSSWDKRRQIDNAVSKELNVFGTDVMPEAYRKASDVVPKAARRSWFGGKAANPLGGAGTHAFLHQTHDWTPEELCLGYALSQPGLSCIFIDADTPDHLESLAAVPERHLPSSVPAQIEMARFNGRAPKSA